MTMILPLFLILLTPLAFARQTITLSPISFQVSAPHVLPKFDEAILHPEGVLSRYKPQGVNVSRKRVTRNEISFIATKKFLFVSKSVYVNGVMETIENGRNCAKGETGYHLRMRFDSSDALVTNNVDELRAVLCVKEESSSKISAVVRPEIITGDRYSRTLGPLAVDLIRDQVSPLLSALTEEIRSMR